MNKNKILNDKPIFVAKRRIFRGLILPAIFLMFALALYSVAQEADKLKDWFGAVFFGVVGVISLYPMLIFKKIMLFDDRIEVHCLNKVIVRTYSQIKRCYVSEAGDWPTMRRLHLECKPKFWHTYLCNIFLHKNDLYKIEEILIKKGIKGDGWI